MSVHIKDHYTCSEALPWSFQLDELGQMAQTVSISVSSSFKWILGMVLMGMMAHTFQRMEVKSSHFCTEHLLDNCFFQVEEFPCGHKGGT